MRGARKDMYTEFWLVYLRERDHLEDLCIEVRIILKWILNRMGKPEGKRPLGRPVHRSEDNINMDLK